MHQFLENERKKNNKNTFDLFIQRLKSISHIILSVSFLMQPFQPYAVKNVENTLFSFIKNIIMQWFKLIA